MVLSGDVPLVSAETIAELVQAHETSGAGATMASTVLEDPSGYGRVVRDEHGTVVSVVETKTDGDATVEQRQIREVNTGVYVFCADALREALGRLSADNAQGELYLPQALDLIRSAGGTVAAHAVSDERLVLGVNDRAGLAQVRALAQEAIHARHMAAGVSIVDPRATVIDVDVQIGRDTTIEPFTTIRGATRIGEGCVVRHSYLIDSVLQDGVTVGPFAYLRPGTVLREGAKAGTFVEIKNSDIGAGRENPAPVLHRRRRRGRGNQPRREHDHGQLRRAREAPHEHRQSGAQQRARFVRCASERRRRRVYGRGIGDR